MSGTNHDFIRNHPKEFLQLVILVICLIWQSGIAIVSFLFYAVFLQLFNIRWWHVVIVGLLAILLSALLEQYFYTDHLRLIEFIHYGFALNSIFWKTLTFDGIGKGLYFLYLKEFNYLISFGLLVSGLLGCIDAFFESPHQSEIRAMQKRQLWNSSDKVDSISLEKKLSALKDEQFDGTAVGVSKYSGGYVVIPDKDVNQLVLVLGTTGAGKTITIRRFYKRAIMQNYPLIIVDGKPTDENVAWVQELAKKYNRPFYGFNCGNFAHYDPLADGGYTELKDKVISLKDEWDSDHYRSIAEDYLQTTFEVLIKCGKKFNLKDVAACLNYSELCILVRETENSELQKRVQSLNSYENNDFKGLQAHLHMLVHSELGAYFELDSSSFTLSQVIAQSGIVYFALPALRFPTFSKVLGKLVMNDIKAVIDHRYEDKKKIFTIFDEYSVFAGEQSLNLANMGREKGLHSIYGTQGLADLDKVDKTFRQQLMNCANTIICHRLNDQESAEAVAFWVGTKEAFTVTAQINVDNVKGGMGSVRKNKEFIIHPDSIKQELEMGEMFYITKVGGFRQDKVKVKYS